MVLICNSLMHPIMIFSHAYWLFGHSFGKGEGIASLSLFHTLNWDVWVFFIIIDL